MWFQTKGSSDGEVLWLMNLLFFCVQIEHVIITTYDEFELVTVLAYMCSEAALEFLSGPDCLSGPNPMGQMA